MKRKCKLIVKIEDGMLTNTHSVSISYGGCCWGGIKPLTDNRLKAVADKIYEYLGSKN